MIGFDTLQGSDVYHWLLHFVQQCAFGGFGRAANGFAGALWARIERICQTERFEWMVLV